MQIRPLLKSFINHASNPAFLQDGFYLQAWNLRQRKKQNLSHQKRKIATCDERPPPPRGGHPPLLIEGDRNLKFNSF